jgi:protein-tyrosine kinase
MDRIRKALDLARLERDRGPDPATTVLPSMESGPAAAPLPRSIAYTHTRVFTANPALLESHRIVDPSGNNPAAAAFRMLRTQVLQRLDENDWRSMAILSPCADDGKTTTAINLAVSLANDSRHTVLLIDSDLRRPAIGAILGIEPEFGLDDILRGEARIAQCLYHPEGFERLVVLPARTTLANSSETLAGPQGRALVAELRARYPERILLFDLPPILGADDALAFLPMLECGLMVVAERATRRADLLRSMELLRRTPIIGTVVNRATDVTSGYG